MGDTSDDEEGGSEGEGCDDSGGSKLGGFEVRWKFFNGLSVLPQ